MLLEMPSANGLNIDPNSLIPSYSVISVKQQVLNLFGGKYSTTVIIDNIII